jgi:signal transduction histidine kinase
MALTVSAPLTDVARARQPLFLESRADWTRCYPHLEPLLDATGHVANAVAPLVANGRLLGVIGAAFDTPRPFGADERALVIAVAAQCAQALERARLYESERDARKEAEAANRAKSEFLAVMSHELRTPLAAIDGYAELMELGVRGVLTEQQRHDLGRIREGQRSLLGLVNGVLNYSRVNAGAVQYERDNVSIDAVLRTCQGLLTPQARAKRLALIYTPCDPRLTVKSDREKLQQIVVNLLTNAVKFTEPEGRVELASEIDARELRITVADTGRGIPADQLIRIFEPFVQVDTGLTRTQGGVGLGLAISRELARGMGGELSVNSSVGVGSTFTLSLPLE